MRIEILNSFTGDNKKDIDTTNADGRAAAAKMVEDMLRSGSAIFLEKEVNGETYTYRVTKYDAASNKLTIRLDSFVPVDADIQPARSARKKHYGTVSPEVGRTVSVAPRSGG